MRFVIAGFGSIGRRHFRNLLSLGERDIILYRTGHSTLPDDELAGFIVKNDLDAALAHGPDAVIVANPTALHLDVAIPAAQAGCHLFLEKPISHSLERSDELSGIVESQGLQVLVGFQLRFHPGLQKIAALLSAGAIGQLLSFRAHWGEYLPNWHPWEDYRQGYAARNDLGGGVVLTLCHPLDYLRWFFGDVEALWSFTSQAGLKMPVEDTAEIGLKFRDVLGSVHLNYNQRPPVHNLEIVGSQGTIRWDNTDGAVVLSQANADGSPGEWQRFPAPEGFERNMLFIREMENFLGTVRGFNKPMCTLQDGIQALKVSLSAVESARSGSLQKLK